MRSLQLLAVVGKVNHRLHVQILRGVKNFRQHEVGVQNRIRVARRGKHHAGTVARHPLLEVARVAAVVVNVTAHQMQDDEIIFVRVDAVKELQQNFVGQLREVEGVVGPLGNVGGLRNQRRRALVVSVASLIAEPVSFVAGFFGGVDNRHGLEKIFVVVLTLLGQRTLQDGYRLRPRGVNISEDDKLSVGGRSVRRIVNRRNVVGIDFRVVGKFDGRRNFFKLAVEPRRIVEREFGVVGVHVRSACGFADNENYRAVEFGGQSVRNVDMQVGDACSSIFGVAQILFGVVAYVAPRACQRRLRHVINQRGETPDNRDCRRRKFFRVVRSD